MSSPDRQRRPLLVFPYNGNGREALDCLGDAFELAGFVDDTPEKQGVSAQGHPVHDRAALRDRADALVLAVPGSPRSFRERRAVIEGLGVEPHRFATVVHPAASISASAKLGRNVLVMAGVVITAAVEIGDHVCVLPNTVIHHDAVVGAYTLIGANVTVAGGVVIGPECYLGSGTSIINDIEIGRRCLIGLGSNVIKGVEAGATVAGNPARPIRSA